MNARSIPLLFCLLFLFFPSISLRADCLSFEPIMKRDERGNRVAIWLSLEDNQASIQAATFSKEQKKWSRPILISSKERTVTTIPKLSLNKSGQAVALWESYDASKGKNYLEIAFYTVGGNWNCPSVISEETEIVKLGDNQLTLDDDGNILVLWSGFTSDSPMKYQIRSVNGGFGRGWSPPTTISND